MLERQEASPLEAPLSQLNTPSGVAADEGESLRCQSNSSGRPPFSFVTIRGDAIPSPLHVIQHQVDYNNLVNDGHVTCRNKSGVDAVNAGLVYVSDSENHRLLMMCFGRRGKDVERYGKIRSHQIDSSNVFSMTMISLQTWSSFRCRFFVLYIIAINCLNNCICQNCSTCEKYKVKSAFTCFCQTYFVFFQKSSKGRPWSTSPWVAGVRTSSPRGSQASKDDLDLLKG